MTASFGWFARHEMRLAWRDASMMLQGGRSGRLVGASIGVVVFVVVLHLVAYAVLKPSMALLVHPDKAALVAFTGSMFLAWTLLLSQAMETVTRSFYARADLDLILSSPASATRLFAIRIAGNAVSSIAMAALLIGPVVDVAALLGGARFLLAYGVLAAMGISALAAAVAATVLMFRIVGPKRTRLLAQIAAAVVGAGFVIGLQVAGIMSYGSLSRTMLLQSPALVAGAPGIDSSVWWPARAATGDAIALVFVLGGAIVLLVSAIAVAAPAFAHNAMVVAGLPTRQAPVGRRMRFRRRSPAQALRSKEWALLWRDPWLVSQSLMQVLYLVPPAFLLWQDFGTGTEKLAVLVPILVMAAGQLSGGLAWLAISGEDAPDLVATAPVTGATVLRAKVEAVMVAVALPIIPIALVMGLAMPSLALTTLVGAALAAAGACAIQFIFRSQAKRSNFRRRQTSSRIATFAEAFLSISLAGAAGLAAAGMWVIALVPTTIAILVLGGSYAVAAPAR